MAVAAARGVELRAQIDGEKAALRSIGADISKLADGLSADAWRDIGRESNHLTETSIDAQWILGITVLVGALIGLLVLFTVPRPIVTAIDQLMAGSQRIARSELRTPVELNSEDELGVLADTFNDMRENLLSLVQRIQRSAVQLSSSINEIQAAATEQAASASQQASAVIQLSSSLNEMSQSAATLVYSSESAGSSVDGIGGIVAGNNQKSAQIMSSMDDIGNSTAQTAERIKSLNDKMYDINEAVSTISMVADQTTLLSFLARLDAIDEVLLPALLRPIPGSPAALLGVLNLRGDMLPIIDLGEHLRNGQGSGTGGQIERTWQRRNRILRMHKDAHAVGVAVDAVQGIRTLRPEQRRGQALGDQAAAGLLGNLWQLGADTLQELHFNALLTDQDLAWLNPQLHRMLS